MEPLEYFEPKDIPAEIRRYGRPLKQLAVGSPGKLGGLRLALSRDDSDGKTVLKGIWRKVPLQTLKAFYYEDSQPDLAFVYILNPTGGTLQGDRLRIDVALGPRCKAHLTTQAATKIYRMNADYATQSVDISLGRDSYLEYLPDQIIPYRGSRFFQDVNVSVQPGSTFVYWEILTSGREGRERFEYDIFYSRLVVKDKHCEPILSDTVALEPGSRDLGRLGMMGQHDTLGNFYVVGEKISESLVERIHSTAIEEDGVTAGVSPTSLTPGLVARVLGPSTRRVRMTLTKFWNEARMEILNSPAPHVRK